MAEDLHKCEECGQEFLYPPHLHICKDKQTTTLHSPFAGMTWIEECMEKQRRGIS